MKLKTWAGVGLVGHVHRFFTEARKTGIPIEGVLWCRFSQYGTERYLFYANIQSSDSVIALAGPAFRYEKFFKTFRDMLTNVTKEVADVRNSFPGLTCIRVFSLPTKEHKRQYYLGSAKLGERWLEQAIRSASSSEPFLIREEFVNGTWVPIKYERHDWTSIHHVAYVMERAFMPYKCRTSVRKNDDPQCVAYKLSDFANLREYQEKIYVYPSDLYEDVCSAINAEKLQLSAKGLRFDSVDFFSLFQEAEDEMYDWTDENENS